MIRSTVALTQELDDIPTAVAELVDSTLSDLNIKKNSVGLLLCDSDADHKALIKGIREKIDMPVFGFSSTAIFTGTHGMVDMSATLTTMTSDDVCFSYAVSEPVTLQNVAIEIEKAYRMAKDHLKAEPIMIMAFPPYILGVMLDIYPRELGRVSGGLPVFGGMPSHDERNGTSAVFCGETAHSDRLAILLIGGNVRPVFSVKSELSVLTDLKRTVTRSVNNQVFTVGDQTFVEFITQLGLNVEQLISGKDRATSFTAYPILVEMQQNEDFDGIPIVRTIHCVDMEDGSATAIGEIPEGSVISMGLLKRQDIERSARNSVTDIKEKMAENENRGYEYSTFFAVSCVARYYVMASQRELEADILQNELPAGKAMSGFYSFGEICPTSIKNGHATNAGHNESLVILAL